MYIFIDQNTIEQYNSEILKMYVGARCIKTISNPTNEDLIEFGYMPLIESEEPEYNPETQYLTFTYSIVDNNIVKSYVINDIPVEEEPIEEETTEEETTEEEPIEENIEV